MSFPQSSFARSLSPRSSLILPPTVVEDDFQLEADNGPAILQFPLNDALSAHRIINPVRAPERPRRRHKPAPEQQELWASEIDPDVLAHAKSIEEEMAPVTIPERQRVWMRNNTPLREFYVNWVLDGLKARVKNGTLARGTLDKDNQALNRWERFTRPDDWSDEKPWPGVPLGYITPKYLERFLQNLFSAEDVAQDTAKSTWNHLRTILNQAVRLRVLDVKPKPESIPKVEDEPVDFYQPHELEMAYRLLKDHLGIQVAFVLGNNAGMRTADVFKLKRSDIDLTGPRPTVEFVARKTKKRQRVPLAPTTVAHLLRLPTFNESDIVFPGLGNPDCKDPERSRPARRRRAVIKNLFAFSDLDDVDKPWQMARATCNKRLEDVRTGVGIFVLGHHLTLNSRHYYEPSDLVFETVCAVKQPRCFLADIG